MKAPRLIRWPLRVQPIPFPAAPPPAIALIRGVMTLSVNALTKVLKASATTRPTAMMMTDSSRQWNCSSLACVPAIGLIYFAFVAFLMILGTAWTTRLAFLTTAAGSGIGVALSVALFSSPSPM